MAHDIIMPVLGMNQDTGTLVRWLRREGERVRKGDAVMEIATDKITTEIEAPADGILAHITAAEGDEVPVGQAVALILAEGETAPARPAAAEAPARQDPARTAPASKAVAASPVARRLAQAHGLDLGTVPARGPRIGKEDVEAWLVQMQEAPVAEPARVRASPKARRLAREQGVDISRIAGTGPEGAVLAADIDTWLSAQATGPLISAPAAETRRPGPLWQVMAQRLTDSWQTVPHFHLSRSVDTGQLQAWRQACRDKYAQRVTLTDLIIKVLAVSLREHPAVNASWQDDGTIRLHGAINIGLATAVQDGLLVPVIPQAEQRAITDIAAYREQLVKAAQDGTLALADLEGGTFTISNLGMFGIENFGAIIKPPEAAILAVGAVRDAVVPVDGAPGIRPMMDITLACDHRALDGATAARFLQTLVQYLEAPLLLLD